MQKIANLRQKIIQTMEMKYLCDNSIKIAAIPVIRFNILWCCQKQNLFFFGGISYKAYKYTAKIVIRVYGAQFCCDVCTLNTFVCTDLCKSWIPFISTKI